MSGSHGYRRSEVEKNMSDDEDLSSDDEKMDSGSEFEPSDLESVTSESSVCSSATIRSSEVRELHFTPTPIIAPAGPSSIVQQPETVAGPPDPVDELMDLEVLDLPQDDNARRTQSKRKAPNHLVNPKRQRLDTVNRAMDDDNEVEESVDRGTVEQEGQISVSPELAQEMSLALVPFRPNNPSSSSTENVSSGFWSFPATEIQDQIRSFFRAYEVLQPAVNEGTRLYDVLPNTIPIARAKTYDALVKESVQIFKNHWIRMRDEYSRLSDTLKNSKAILPASVWESDEFSWDQGPNTPNGSIIELFAYAFYWNINTWVHHMEGEGGDFSWRTYKFDCGLEGDEKVILLMKGGDGNGAWYPTVKRREGDPVQPQLQNAVPMLQLAPPEEDTPTEMDIEITATLYEDLEDEFQVLRSTNWEVLYNPVTSDLPCAPKFERSTCYRRPHGCIDMIKGVICRENADRELEYYDPYFPLENKLVVKGKPVPEFNQKLKGLVCAGDVGGMVTYSHKSFRNNKTLKSALCAMVSRPNGVPPTFRYCANEEEFKTLSKDWPDQKPREVSGVTYFYEPLLKEGEEKGWFPEGTVLLVNGMKLELVGLMTSKRELPVFKLLHNDGPRRSLPGHLNMQYSRFSLGAHSNAGRVIKVNEEGVEWWLEQSGKLNMFVHRGSVINVKQVPIPLEVIGLSPYESNIQYFPVGWTHEKYKDPIRLSTWIKLFAYKYEKKSLRHLRFNKQWLEQAKVLKKSTQELFLEGPGTMDVPGFVYLFHVSDSIFKIGSTRNVVQRLGTLTSSNKGCDVTFTPKGNVETSHRFFLERLVHSHLANSKRVQTNLKSGGTECFAGSVITLMDVIEEMKAFMEKFVNA